MGVIDVFCWQCGQSSLLKRCDQLCLILMSINLFFISSFDSSPFFCRLLSIGCATALPMGVAPEAIAEIFGYRLKKIDTPVPYISSRVICLLYSPLQWISPLLMMQAPKSKTRWTCPSWQIFSYSLLSSLFYFVHIFFLDTLIPLYYLHYKNPEVYFWALPLQRPISTCL
jgi:hypothetical protein